jgi:alpha-beta hydrolase superfamily lysophospholipase
VATFGLIHGAWHGAWCWERLAPRLVARGHAARTSDLPIEDPDATMSDWVDTIIASLEDAPDPVMLVGHSLGGVLLPLVAARRPVARQVYLAAILHPSLLPPDAPHPHPRGVFRPLDRFPDGSHRWPSVAAAAPALYGRCTPEDATWAFARLRRQQTARPWAEVPAPPAGAASPVSAVACTDDRVVDPGFVRWAAVSALDADLHELDADHSPFLSEPDALADLLDMIARGAAPGAVARR